MEFKRKRARVADKHSKEWRDETGNYRVTWRDEAHGIAIPAAFYSCVRCVREDGSEFWSFCGARRPYRTFGKAIECAEKHRRAWEAAQQVAGSEYKGRADRLRALRAKAVSGNGCTFIKLLDALPTWVVASADPQILRILVTPPKRRRDDDDFEDAA